MKIMYKHKGDFPKEIPDTFLNEVQAQKNHGQTLHRLNERGGMCPSEIMCNIKRIGLFKHDHSDEQNIKDMQEIIKLLQEGGEHE